MLPFNISQARRPAIAARHVLALVSTIALAACQDAPTEPRAQSPQPDAILSGGGCGITACPPPPPRIAYVRYFNTIDSIFTAYPDGSGIKRVARGWQPAWSPDRQKLAFAGWVGGHFQIFKVNADGTGLTQLTYKAVNHQNPKWSPDGTRIAFEGNVKDTTNTDIYIIRADGTGLVRLTSKPAWDGQPTWRPDGKYIAFATTRDGKSQIFKINVDGTTHIATKMTYNVAGAYQPAYSPDGTKLLWTTVESVAPPAGTPARLRAGSWSWPPTAAG